MSAAGGYGPALSGALKDLMVYWERTSFVWNDSARDSFEADFLKDVGDAVRSAVTALDQIELLLRQVRHECE
jgi:hypothetical protein